MVNKSHGREKKELLRANYAHKIKGFVLKKQNSQSIDNKKKSDLVVLMQSQFP
jgi:hypothetical protein